MEKTVSPQLIIDIQAAIPPFDFVFEKILSKQIDPDFMIDQPLEQHSQ
jgi:hypothetical protein